VIKEVRQILDLHSVSQNMSNDLAKVTRSHIPTANVSARIDVLVGHKIILEGCNVPIGHIVPEGWCTPAAS